MNALHPAIQAALAPFAPQAREHNESRYYLPESSFNDDDFYIYAANTKELIRIVGCKSVYIYTARTVGLEVQEGQTWGRGQAVKGLGLWWPV